MQKRTPIEIINEMDKSGDLKILVDSGFCSPTVLFRLEIDRTVGAKMAVGVKKSRAISEVAEEFKVCNRTVFRIVRDMRR